MADINKSIEAWQPKDACLETDPESSGLARLLQQRAAARCENTLM
jgi:hypothetical protein